MPDYLFDYSKLLGRIKEKCGTQAVFANKMGIAISGMSARLNNRQEFDAREIIKACDTLDIPIIEIPLYFFALKVQKSELLV